jgi:hypothetical protein
MVTDSAVPVPTAEFFITFLLLFSTHKIRMDTLG